MIAELITRLAPLQSIGTVVTVANALTASPTDLHADEAKLPAVYLYPGDDQPDGGGYDGCPDIMISEAVHVLYVCAPGDLDAVKQGVRELLIGYQPTGKQRQLDFVVGGIIPDGIRGTLVWYRDIFTTSYFQTTS